MSPAQEPAALERRYRRLLCCYPPSHRAAHREEMLGVLLAAARPGQRMPGASQTLNLVACGLAIRARRALTAGPWQDALAWPSRDDGRTQAHLDESLRLSLETRIVTSLLASSRLSTLSS